jgi:hypothetical protein
MEKKKSTQVTGCTTCKKGLNKTQTSILILGIYMLFSSIYGTVEIVKSIYNLF